MKFIKQFAFLITEMSMKEVIELLNDLKESHKQIALRLKMIEMELIFLKDNIPGKITNIIKKTEEFDKRVSQKYVEKLLAKKFASKHTYQKGSMDEKLIQEFLNKNKIEEIEEIQAEEIQAQDHKDLKNTKENSSQNE